MSASSRSTRRPRFFKMPDRAFKLVTAAGIAESDDIIAVPGQRVGLHRLAGPGAGLVDAIVNVEIGHGVSLSETIQTYVHDR